MTGIVPAPCVKVMLRVAFRTKGDWMNDSRSALIIEPVFFAASFQMFPLGQQRRGRRTAMMANLLADGAGKLFGGNR